MTTSVAAWILWVPPVFALVAIFLTWVYYATRDEWPYETARTGYLYRCSACGRVYVEMRRVPMSRCPSCDHLNEAPHR